MASLSKKAQYLHHWNDLAQTWIERSPSTNVPDPALRAQTNQALTQLLFGFGLGRAGEVKGAADLLQAATRTLRRTSEEARDFLADAFQFRLEQSLSGAPHSGRLPEQLLQRLDQYTRLTRYCVDRLRQELRVLEPDEVIDPYQLWVVPGSSLDHFEEEILRLPTQSSSQGIQQHFGVASRLASQQTNPAEARTRLLSTTLSLITRLDECFARQLVGEAVLHLEKLAVSGTKPDWPLGTCLLQLTWNALGRLGDVELLDRLLPAFYLWVTFPLGDLGSDAVSAMLLSCFRSLTQMGRLETLENCAKEATAHLLYDSAFSDGTYRSLKIPLALSEAWLAARRPDRAWPFLNATRDLLLGQHHQSASNNRSRERFRLAVQYVLALRRASLDEANERFEELFFQMSVPHSTSSVELFCSLRALTLLDAIVISSVDVEPPHFHVATSL